MHQSLEKRKEVVVVDLEDFVKVEKIFLLFIGRERKMKIVEREMGICGEI